MLCAENATPVGPIHFLRYALLLVGPRRAGSLQVRGLALRTQNLENSKQPEPSSGRNGLVKLQLQLSADLKKSRESFQLSATLLFARRSQLIADLDLGTSTSRLRKVNLKRKFVYLLYAASAISR